MASSHKVLISGISSNIPKDTFISILFDFGDMVTMFIDDHNVSNGRKSGYVVYKTKLECFRAISGLNEQPPHYLSLQYGGIYKNEINFENQPEDSRAFRTPVLNRAFQTQHTTVKYPRVIQRNSENCKEFVASEKAEDKEVKLYPSGRKKFGCKNYSPGTLKNVIAGIAATDDQLNFEVGCESGALLKQSNCIKESAFDGRPDKTKGKCLYCERLGDESCEKCGARYCSRKCQMNDWSRHKHECICSSRESNDVESEGAETAMQMKDSANQNEETRLLGDPAQLKSQGTLNKEDQGGHSDKFFMHVNMGAVVKEGRKAEVKEMRGKNWNKSNWTSHSQTGVLDRRRFTESDPVKKGEDMISLHSKYEVIESDKSNRISGDENFKGACITKARCSEMKRKHVHGIGRGVSVFKDWATLESMSTVMVGNESDNSGGAKSGSHFDEMKSLDASSKFCDQGFERQAYQESERCESSASECISPLSRNLRKLISLNEQQKQKDKVQTFVVKPIRKKEMSSVKEDISSVKAPTRNVSPSSENRRKLEAGDVQGRGNENEGVKKDIELHSGVLAKVSELPAATEIVKAKAHQEVNGNAASSKESPWNLFSGDPKTQIVNYDLCTQQKKLSSEVFSKVNISSLISSGNYWVQSIDTSDLDVIQDMMINKKKTSEDPFKPCLGDYCCIFHNDMWYRAKVLFMKELEILAALIDYGRIVCVKAELLQELPHVAKSFYAQAVHVMVDPRTPAEYLNYQEGDVLAVKACGMMEEGITKVQLEGVLYAQEVVIPKQLSFAPLINENEIPDTTKGVQWPPSVLCLLKTGDVMSCTVLNVLLNEEDNRDEMVVAIAFEDIANDLECIAADLPTDCMEQLKNPEFNPSIGDMVAAFSNEFNSWVRSIVLDAGCGHWLVACFDFGFIEEVTEIRYIPSDKKYKKSPALSAECLVTKSLFPREDLFCEGRIERNVTLNAKVLKKKDDCLECEFGPNGDQTFCFVTLSVWSPKLNSSAYATLNDGKLLPDPTLDIVKLTPGCSVKIVSYFESLVIYVQPCDAKSKLLMMELHDGITNFAVKNSALKEVPVKGKKYICQYSGDMKYYRVVVKRIINPAKIHIYYIDFGNEETVTNRKLYELPPEFEKIPSFAVKIELKKEFSNVLSIDARKYLSNLILDNKELVLNYTDGNLKNAELLIHNHSLSDILKEFINS